MKASILIDIISFLLACTWWVNVTLLGQGEGIIGARPLEKMKPRENVKFINSVNRGSARQAWNSFWVLMENRKKMSRQFQWDESIKGFSFPCATLSICCMLGLTLRKQVCSAPRRNHIQHRSILLITNKKGHI